MGLVLREVAVVPHQDDDRVVRDAQPVHLRENVADPAVELFHALDLRAAVRGRELIDRRSRKGQRD